MSFRESKYGLLFRFVEESDAEFIVRLRTQPEKAQFLHAVSVDVEKQKEWIYKYKEREKAEQEFYFICEKDGEPISLFRLYNRTENTITGGSWIMKNGVDSTILFQIDLFELDYVFEQLKMKKKLIDVRKNNKKVVKYHKNFHKIISEDDLNVYMEMDHELYLRKKKYLEMILGYI
jgi:hypothetical protein